MKMILFSMMAFLASSGIAIGQNALTVGNFTLPQNGATMRVTLTFDEENVYTSYQFKIETPEGMGYVTDQDDDVECTLGTGHTNSHGAAAHWNEGTRQLTIGVSSNKSALFSGQTVVLDIPMSATSANVGTTHNFNITGIDFIKQENATKVGLSDVPFTVTIGEPADTRTILDETSTVAPVAASGVDVRVIRTIGADTWSTICLPFAMTEEQVKAVFGEDVQLGDFTGYDTTEEGDEIIGITANFKSATEIQANHPYIIKVSAPMTEFTVDGVDVAPEESPCVSYGFTTGKGKNAVYHPIDFNGTYVADFDIFNDAQSRALFLSGNKFFYATENTKHMKAFRAYFDFDDVLAEVEESASRVSMFFNEELTDIDKVSEKKSYTSGAIYDLQGRRVNKPVKGIFIKDGKKIVIEK